MLGAKVLPHPAHPGRVAVSGPLHCHSVSRNPSSTPHLPKANCSFIRHASFLWSFNDRLKLVSDICTLPRQRPWVLVCAAEPPCRGARKGSSLRAAQHRMDVPVPCGGSLVVFLQGYAQGITPCLVAVGKKPHSVATERVILPLCNRFFC